MNAAALRASILQLAIQGKLVPQRDDEPSVEQIGEAPEDVRSRFQRNGSGFPLALYVDTLNEGSLLDIPIFRRFPS